MVTTATAAYLSQLTTFSSRVLTFSRPPLAGAAKISVGKKIKIARVKRRDIFKKSKEVKFRL